MIYQLNIVYFLKEYLVMVDIICTEIHLRIIPNII
jgi:hypothetical protein